MIDRGNWIQTYSGKKFYALDPQPEDITIEDIAHALSRMCRYAGHCDKFYSVAEHSVLVAEAADNKLWALLHDASEAYLVDIPRPFKGYLTNYYELESKVMNAVCDKFGLPHEMPKDVHWIDSNICLDEAEQNMKNAVPSEWRDGMTNTGAKLNLWTPDEAEEQFLAFFDALVEQENARVSA